MNRETLTEHDIEHRREFAEYATRHSDREFHRPVLDRLYRHWVSINRDHFAGACVEPTIDLVEPKSARLLGEYDPVGSHGQKGGIRIRPNLVTGKHPALREGDDFAEGRMRYVEDVLLHESVHQYCGEVLHDDGRGYKGHGPTFAGECNRIGAALGLPEVRPAKARGPLKELPSCAGWPMCVRPRDYYLGALADPEPERADDAPAAQADTFPCPLDPWEAVPVVMAHMDEAGREILAAGITGRAATVDAEATAVDAAVAIGPPARGALEGPPVPAGRGEAVGTRPKPGRRVSADGGKAKEARAVSANGDAAAAGPPARKGRIVPAGGEKPKGQAEAKGGRRVPAGRGEGSRPVSGDRDKRSRPRQGGVA
jgi:hypothetical protein